VNKAKVGIPEKLFKLTVQDSSGTNGMSELEKFHLIKVNAHFSITA